MTYCRRKLFKVKSPISQVPRKIHRAEVANGSLSRRRDLRDLRAEIREVDNILRKPRLIALDVAGILEHHPAVARLGERTHHSRIQVTGFYLPGIQLLLLGLNVGLVKLFTI